MIVWMRGLVGSGCKVALVDCIDGSEASVGERSGGHGWRFCLLLLLPSLIALKCI